jgi:hypothetical protein
MQCVQAITDVPFLNISSITDSMPIGYFRIATML